MIEGGASHFEDFDGLVYLNCANHGPLPRVTVRAIEEAIPLKTYPNRVPDDIYFRLPDRARAAIAPLIGARPEEITLGTGSAHGMNLAALGFPFEPHDEVVIGASEFPSNIYIWANAARRHGARPVYVRGRGRAATTQDLLDAVTPDTRVIVASLVDFGTGQVRDVERLGRFCAERDIFLAVDATQACGVMPVDVVAQRISILAVGAYKWMLSPYGTGFARLDPAWWDRVPPTALSWTAAEGAENFNTLPRGDWSWAATARRYDAPEAASYINVSGLARSAELIGEIGLADIHRHVTGLLDRLAGGLPAPFRRREPRGEPPGPMLVVETDDPARVRAAHAGLRENGVVVSLREDGIRVSPHIYNSPEHIDRFLELLASS